VSDNHEDFCQLSIVFKEKLEFFRFGVDGTRNNCSCKSFDERFGQDGNTLRTSRSAARNLIAGHAGACACDLPQAAAAAIFSLRRRESALNCSRAGK
jgi:hypothetical protein